MEPTIRELGEMNVIGVAAPFISILSPDTTADTVIPKLWEELMERADEVPGKRGNDAVGLCSALPENVEQNHDDECWYVAGFPVENLDNVPEGMTGLTVPAATCASFTHRGSLEHIDATMEKIYADWLPSSRYERADFEQPDIEWYGEAFNQQSDNSAFDILIPLRT